MDIISKVLYEIEGMMRFCARITYSQTASFEIIITRAHFAKKNLYHVSRAMLVLQSQLALSAWL